MIHHNEHLACFLLLPKHYCVVMQLQVQINLKSLCNNCKSVRQVIFSLQIDFYS